MTETSHDTGARAAIALFVTEPVRRKMFPAPALERVGVLGELREVPVDAMTPEAALDAIAGCDAVLSGWRSPALTEAFLAAHDRPRFVGYIGASIRHMMPTAAIESGRLTVSHAAIPIAAAVAEFTLAQMLEHLKRTRAQDQQMRSRRDWFELREAYVGRQLGAQTVGIVGAGYVGRLVIRLLAAFGCDILVYDPYLPEDRARELGVRPGTLDEVMAGSDIVSLHAPVLPETRHMIDAGRIALLRDGGLLINTARAAIVDEAALAEALRTRDITAAIDVFADEPLPPDSPFRTLPNAILSPHTAGHTWETYLQQGNMVVDELERFLSGQPLRHQVTPAMLKTMA
ncbi:hydroxyacid dehydrogenase [Rhodobacteraceae bacterium 2CG4]|uniref:Hydroxyacid dehydrogenase n=1 Tax=Halovulum marinum TaxID=2662447 RepID=A0A6L5Z3U7_9RHOB|nr:hydroxyacid dehydrogenase [Halovulum marinum]MSU90755.1 hydroxyacid dehydrogenase [Halovulum marinum]